MQDRSDSYSYEFYVYTQDLIDYYRKKSGYDEDRSDDEWLDCRSFYTGLSPEGLSGMTFSGLTGPDNDL